MFKFARIIYRIYWIQYEKWKECYYSWFFGIHLYL